MNETKNWRIVILGTCKNCLKFLHNKCKDNDTQYQCSFKLSIYLVLLIKNTKSLIFESFLFFVFIALSSHVMIYE